MLFASVLSFFYKIASFLFYFVVELIKASNIQLCEIKDREGVGESLN